MKPVLITQRDLIRGLPEKWRRQYPDGGYYGRKDVQGKLDALNCETATVEDVAAIIGNTSWTDIHCDACDESVPWIVRVGQEPDYESATAHLCGKCLADACACRPLEDR